MLFKKMVRLPRLELGTSTLSVSRSNQLSYNRKCKSWRLGDSNSWPSECKSDALPTELNPQIKIRVTYSSSYFALYVLLHYGKKYIPMIC